MKLATPIIAGAAVLALANVALADEASLSTADQPILLTDAQMDSVTAGTAGGSWFSEGDADVFVSGFSVNIPGVFAYAEIFTETVCFGDTCLTGQFAFGDVNGF
jgi:hypothetical protein